MEEILQLEIPVLIPNLDVECDGYVGRLEEQIESYKGIDEVHILEKSRHNFNKNRTFSWQFTELPLVRHNRKYLQYHNTPLFYNVGHILRLPAL